MSGRPTLGYDYEGRVTSIAGPGVSDAFTYNGLDTRVGKVDSSGTSTYRRDGAGVTAPVLGDGSAVYTPGVSQRRSGSTTYDLHDQLGSAVKQTGSTATVTATRTYDAYGMLLASTGTPQGPFGFAAASGYQEDGDTGLKLLGHRYYDPSTGRFLTRDPAQDGRNWYAYCGNNPTRRIDPNGHTFLFPPNDSGFAGAGWELVPSRYPYGRTWTSPDGDAQVDFHWPNASGRGGFQNQDHFHLSWKDEEGNFIKDLGGRKGGHFLPEDESPIPLPEPPFGPPVPPVNDPGLFGPSLAEDACICVLCVVVVCLL